VPATHELWVKEHSNAIGDRSVSWYRTVKSIPGVRLIDPYADTSSLISRADLVISASGTVCFEAGILGIPAATFATMFFSPLLVTESLDPYSLSRENLYKLLGKKVFIDEGGRRNILASIYAQSFEGRIGDPVHDPECMNPENIQKVSDAIGIVVNNAVRV
jgi:hypothetical protein